MKNLYDIMLAEVKQMPSYTIGFSGYQALISLLNWVLPLDTNKTLTTLVETLCQDIMSRIGEHQADTDVVLYRTRFHKEGACEYPFDTCKFQPKQALTAN